MEPPVTDRPLRIALAQIDPVVGDLEGNVNRILGAVEGAREAGADLVVTPELAVTGYPPQDLLLRQQFVADCAAALDRLLGQVRDVDLVVGHPEPAEEGLFNSASWVRNGAVVARYRKRLLPNYGVFDEKRYFHTGTAPCVVEVAGVPVGVTICEDAWAKDGPMSEAVDAGARILVNLNASPYDYTKLHLREREIGDRAREVGVPIAYVNLVGGQDELVFDGASFAVDAGGDVVDRAPSFEPGLRITEWNRTDHALQPAARALLPSEGLEEGVHGALTTGIRDYVDKNGFPGVVVGLSGGIDSALTLSLAVEALGPERVEAVFMPSRYTADMSGEDSRTLAANLGIPLHELPIDGIHRSFFDTLQREFGAEPHGVTAENIQARARGILLMAISNEKGLMVLATGNKSEMSMGYATLYGDMVGGFSALKDVPKTLVYRLARHINREEEVIPWRIIERPPSAELAPDQKDSDTLPPYEVLDDILYAYVEEDLSPATIAARGYDEALVRRVLNRVENNEYKRRQAPPGVRISPRGFGTDRRYPITNKYRF
ncbi:MAG: NAD+ synthase [Thiohalorhabdus sp.]|uniref:NAD+ synthase n=1 Tax=Thiohalorhabdus sp. TaxID=3094134 RepID=UPI00397F4C34